MAKLPRPQAPARFRTMFPDLADWLDSPWTGRPPFPTGQVFRVEETTRDECFVIRAELPGLDPENDIEVTLANGHKETPQIGKVNVREGIS